MRSDALAVVCVLLTLGLHCAPAEPPVTITPPFADRLFPYVTYREVWQGTPAARPDVAVPNVAIVYGADETPAVVGAAGRVAFFLGTCVEDVGFGVSDVKAGTLPPVLISDAELAAAGSRHLIVVGTRNTITAAQKLTFTGPTVIEREVDGRRALLVAGATDQEVLRAARYLAEVRLNFKSGAYTTFFDFVRLRALIENENWIAAAETIRSPQGLSACGKNMALMLPGMAAAPDKVRGLIQHWNGLLYGKLPSAVEAKNKAEAVAHWKAAMETCYACHQGAGEFPVLRRFVPPDGM